MTVCNADQSDFQLEMHSVRTWKSKAERKLKKILPDNGKGVSITGHEGPRGMWMQGSTYSQPQH